jgi:leader peptidase (prepilin peptidase) / N-methyltransferase
MSMFALGALFFFLLGLVVGSFLNVVAFRYNTGMTMRGRSYCFSCGKKLHWYELIPVLSFFVQRGRCRQCGAKISYQYLLVELLTGTLFLGLFLEVYSASTLHVYSALSTLYYVLVFSLLVVILVYDFRHKIIPDGLVYTFITLSFLFVVLSTYNGGFTRETMYHLIAGPLLFTFFFLLWFISRGTWMGFGDAKLALGMGWFLGLVGGISAVVLAFWIGAAVGVLMLLIQKLPASSFVHRLFLFRGLNTLTIKSEIPFAPFLILGLWLVFFFQIDVLQLSFLTTAF